MDMVSYGRIDIYSKDSHLIILSENVICISYTNENLALSNLFGILETSDSIGHKMERKRDTKTIWVSAILIRERRRAGAGAAAVDRKNREDIEGESITYHSLIHGDLEREGERGRVCSSVTKHKLPLSISPSSLNNKFPLSGLNSSLNLNGLITIFNN